MKLHPPSRSSLPRAGLALTVVAAAALLSACAWLNPAPPVLRAAQPGALQACTELAQRFAHPQTRIDKTEAVAAGALKQGGRDVPAHCLVVARLQPRKGADGRDYAIGFEMRLPQQWNGRFYYQGNGGLDGVVQPALGALGGGPLTGALMQGFAVVSADAGHTGAQTPFFGLEPQARLDYGYQAVAALTPVAKQLIASAYGRGPDRSYIGGCSNGGRHTLVAAARLGNEYDGYLAGAPGYRLPMAALTQLWAAQQWSRVATPGATVKHPMNPSASLADLGSGFTPAERQSVARGILAQCDALDGARDGIVGDIAACQAKFSLDAAVPTCSGARDGQCLSAAQKQVLSSVYQGSRDGQGRALYSRWDWDPGMAGSNWATWKFINALALDPLAVGTVFSVPPGPVDPLKADIDELLRRMGATNDTYRESGLSLMQPPGEQDPVNLRALRERGARMIVYHGVSDPIFSAEDSRQWWERVNRAQNGRGADFARYFPVPGMNHCSAGPATDRFDLLTPLVQWVEQGVAPQAVAASARGSDNPELPADWAPARTRPLCAWPTVARYKGQGSLDDAASFQCQ